MLKIVCAHMHRHQRFHDKIHNETHESCQVQVPHLSPALQPMNSADTFAFKRGMTAAVGPSFRCFDQDFPLGREDSVN